MTCDAGRGAELSRRSTRTPKKGNCQHHCQKWRSQTDQSEPNAVFLASVRAAKGELRACVWEGGGRMNRSAVARQYAPPQSSLHAYGSRTRGPKPLRACIGRSKRRSIWRPSHACGDIESPAHICMACSARPRAHPRPVTLRQLVPWRTNHVASRAATSRGCRESCVVPFMPCARNQ